MFDATIVWLFLIFMWFVIVVPLLLTAAFQRQKKTGDFHWSVFLIALPVLSISVPSYLTLAFHSRTQGLMTLSVLFVIPLIYLFIKEKTKRRRYLKIFILSSVTMVLINPNLIQFWDYKNNRNVIFEDKDLLRITRICEKDDRTVTDPKTNKVYHPATLVQLRDGRLVSGLFNIARAKAIPFHLLREHDQKPDSQKMVRLKIHQKKRDRVLFNFKWVEIENDLYSTVDIGDVSKIYERKAPDAIKVVKKPVSEKSKKTIIEGQGVGGIVVGQSSRSDVLAVFGDDFELVRIRVSRFQMDYKKRGITFEYNPKDMNEIIQSIYFNQNFSGQTSKGIVMNKSSEQDVVTTYKNIATRQTSENHGTLGVVLAMGTKFYYERDPRVIPAYQKNKIISRIRIQDRNRDNHGCSYELYDFKPASQY